MLATDPEIGVDAGISEPGPQPGQSRGPRVAIRVRPAPQVSRQWWSSEIRGRWYGGRPDHGGVPYVAMFFWCSANVRAKTVVPSGLARK